VIGWDYASRYSELVRTLTGEQEIVPPGLILEADRPEFSWLKREFRFMANAAAGPVAAQNAAVGITNQINAQGAQQANIIVITRLRVLGTNGAARTLIITVDRNTSSLNAALFAKVNPTDWRMARKPDGTGPIPFLPVQTVSGTLAGISGQIMGHRQQPIGVDMFDDQLRVILPPNSEILVWSNTVNDLITVNWEGYYRQARREEINPE
jgi:hypothetical protein